MWGRALAGAIAGFFLAAAITGLICWLPAGTWRQMIVPGLVIFVPLWIGAAGASFAFANAKRAWIALTLAALAAFALLGALVTFGLVE